MAIRTISDKVKLFTLRLMTTNCKSGSFLIHKLDVMQQYVRDNH